MECLLYVQNLTFICFTLVGIVLYAMPCYIGPLYNETLLHLCNQYYASMA